MLLAVDVYTKYKRFLAELPCTCIMHLLGARFVIDFRGLCLNDEIRRIMPVVHGVCYYVIAERISNELQLAQFLLYYVQ